MNADVKTIIAIIKVEKHILTQFFLNLKSVVIPSFVARLQRSKVINQPEKVVPIAAAKYPVG